MSDNTLQDAREVVGIKGNIQITNHEAYKQFLELSNHPILNEKKFITVSDGRTLTLAYPKILQQIKNLPLKEQQQIAVRKKIFNRIHGQRNSCYTRAYGTHVSHDGIQKKKGNITSPLLQRKEEIIELFGRMFTVQEVHRVCLEDWDLKVTTGTLNTFREVNKHIILQKIEEYKKTYDNVRLGHKRPRLEELSWLYMKRKANYNASGKVEDHRLLLQTLEQIRKEVEGDSLRIDGNMNINLELTIKNQIESDLMKHILVKEIIISRVAAKMGIDPAKMMTAIKSSYYKKRLEMVEDIPHEEVVYPSSATYDFAKIEAINKQREQKDEIEHAKFLEGQNLPAAKVAKTEDIKNKLIAQLLGKKEAVNKIKNSVYFNSVKSNDEEEE